MELLINFWSVVKQILSVIIGIGGIGFLIGLHEWGHFIFCKLFNVYVPSFSIGFGPVLWKKQIGETLFSLAAMPIGGYVEIAGSEEVGQGEQKHALRRDDRSLKSKSYFQKLFIMLGGIICNFAFSYLVIIALFYTGTPASPLFAPENATTTLEVVSKDSPAEKAGLLKGDVITSFNGVTINTEDNQKLLEAIGARAGQPTQVIVDRQTWDQNKDSYQTDMAHMKPFETTVTPTEVDSNGKTIGMIGIRFISKELPGIGFFESIKRGITATNLLIANTFNAIKCLFVKRDMTCVGGPLMIIAATVENAQKGLKLFLLLLAFVSANLAVLNLVPLPILDGGQILLLTIESLLRRELSLNIKLAIHYACWIGFWILTIYLTYKDIGRIIKSIFVK